MPDTIQSILHDRTSGASALLARFVSEIDHLKKEEFWSALQQLQAAFPVMAVWKYAEEYFTEGGWSTTTVKQFKIHIQTAREKVLSAAETKLSEFSRFLTISRSSLVESFLLTKTRSDGPHVVCSISLPGEEGLDLHHNLKKAGAASKCVQDWELVHQLDSVDVVLMGADWLTDEVIVNKWGSAELVDEANRLNKPVYVLAESFKHTAHSGFDEGQFHQDRSTGVIQRKIKVFEIIPRTPGIIVL